MMKHLNIGNKQNSWKKIRDIAIWPLRVYVYYKTRTSIIFNTFLCLSRKCRTKLIELFDFFIRVLFVTQNCLQWKLCWACFFLNTSCTIGFRCGHLGGFGADMFEAEINKLKEKNRTLCLPSRSLTINQVIIQTRINVSQGKPTDLRLNWPRIWTNVKKEGWPSPVFRREAWILLTCLICLNVLEIPIASKGSDFDRESTQKFSTRKRQKVTHIYSIQWWLDRADPIRRIVEKTALDFIYMYLPRLVLF